ncbi:MAG: peptidoglycan editing factor PgeF [Candidatus Gastranaerophilales bacterium]|nr:peptidoglycan editing factor PgeF [Candidatus Gastranaerophilales bacterium]
MYKLEKFMGKRVLTSSFIDDAFVTAFFTTRDLPLKAGERKDLAEEVENNKKLICEALKIPFENLIIPQQTHSDNVLIIKEKGKGEKGKAKMKNSSSLSSHLSPLTSHSFASKDAVVTNQPDVAIALNFADCVPIIFYDPVKRVVAAAHAGWRGTTAQIGPKTVKKMAEEFSCEPKDIIALIGPAIGKCCFEVKEDVLKKLAASVNNQSEEAFSDNHVDLKLVNKFQLLTCGVEKIDVCEYCTSCQNELFYSYRKEHGNTARHSAVVMINSK